MEHPVSKITSTLISTCIAATLLTPLGCDGSGGTDGGSEAGAADAGTDAGTDTAPRETGGPTDTVDDTGGTSDARPHDSGAPMETAGGDAADGTTGDDTGGGVPVDECSNAPSDWIWCDDFEKDRLSSYFEHGKKNGSFVRKSGVGVGGSTGMRARFSKGQVGAGNLHLAFGDTPQSSFDPVDSGTKDYREIYWRWYVKYESGWTGGGGAKMTRATSFASSNSWAQAMIAHLWSGDGNDRDYLVMDPASGTDEQGNLQTTKYNDFNNLRWLGAKRGITSIFDTSDVGRWYCVEAHVKLNDPQKSDGTFEFWIDGSLQARSVGLNWVGSFQKYGINAVFLENYWNGGSPADQERYFDNFVVSTSRIGCGGN